MSVPSLHPDEARRLIEQGKAVLIDIRSPQEHARERIPGAVCIPLDQLQQAAGPVPEGPVVFHCRSGMRTDANRAVLAQASAGQPCYVLEGGIEGWKRHGHSTLFDRSQPIDIMRQVQIAAGTLVLIGVLGGVFVTPLLYGLAGFVGAGLTFAGLSGFCGMARLLALMPWNRAAQGA
ncbi:MAG TPA: rhodanese family protein [Novosphingobium sp.]|nr:rhodanese family protein [Novosphingobium sp.]